MNTFKLNTILLIAIITCSMSCSTTNNVNKNEAKKFDKTILVLSVGAEKGLAHIGAIEALKEKQVKIDAVFGTSMGSLIGSLYAVYPNQPLKESYLTFINRYFEKTAGSLWKKLWLAAGSRDLMSLQRAKQTLNESLNNGRIEGTAIPFATSYYKKSNNKIEYIIADKGNLAEAVASSIDNYYIFGADDMTRIDPGLDRLASIPVEDACKTFGPAHIIAINVGTNPIMVSKEFQCTYTEIKVPLPDFTEKEMREIFLGKSKSFNAIINSGYEAVMNGGSLE